MSTSLPEAGQRTHTASVIDTAREQGRAAFIGYLPAGFPSVDTAVEAAKAVADGGADIIELGLPYSDPSLDGPVIQDATATALAAGIRTRDVLASVERITRYAPHVAVVVMTYWNPVLRYGPDRFARDLAAAGGAGLITPDITPDYGQEWIDAADAHGLDKVFLVAPSSTPQRLTMTVQACRGFVYAASLMGVTGERAAVDSAARDLVQRVRVAATDHGGEPRVCVGLGVSTPAQAREVAGYADGVIVGSALVRALGQGGVDAVRRTTEDLVQGVRAGRQAG
ncbi:MAG: tryptophan synthase subunit alpha [Actinomycetales bacterium]